MTTWAELFERSPAEVSVEEVREALAEHRSRGGDGIEDETEEGGDE